MKKNRILNYKLDSYFFELYKKHNETTLEAKKRFFLDLKCNDEFMKFKHEVHKHLLKCFIQLCEKNNLQYVAAFGTALGAVRHKGFIPWDDDVDVYMTLEDLDKLTKCVGDNFIIKGADFKKFMYKKIPGLFWIDIFPIMPIKCSPQKAIDLYYFYRNKIENKTHKRNYKKLCVKNQFIFNDQLTKKFNFNDIQGYIYSIWVPDDGRACYFDKNIVLPLKSIDFYDFKIKVFNNIDKYLSIFYDDYYTMPFNDMHQHFDDPSKYDKNKILTYIKNLNIE